VRLAELRFAAESQKQDAQIPMTGGCQIFRVIWTSTNLHAVAEQNHELIERGFPISNGLGPFLGHIL
jgi:hypothetical protein